MTGKRRWKELRAAFNDLVELDRKTRATRLDALQKRDPEIHRRVTELLRADARAGKVLGRFDPPPAPAPAPSLRDQIASEMRDRLNRALEERYRIGEELGRGGMAIVYLARDLVRDESVAMKVLEPDLGRAVGPDRFLREIRIAHQLKHPGIVPVEDSGQADGLLYYVMPHLEGESLRIRLDRDGALPLRRALETAIQCADALAHAHDQGIIHRDVKPANIFLTGGRAMLVDLGIARALDQGATETLTETGISVGTVGYMSPEQAAGERELDGRTDVYGLGCVLYEMLACEPVFRGPTPHAILARQMFGAPPSLRVVCPGVPESVEALIRRALQPEAGDRYGTAVELGEALRGVLEDL